MKRLLKILDVPIPYMIAASMSAIILIYLRFTGVLSVLELILASTALFLIASQIHYGSIVIKNVIGFAINLYLISLYTQVIISIYGLVIQPFFLSWAMFTIFLAQTYSKQRNYELRSRILWGSIMLAMLIVVKLIVVFNDLGFWIAEIIGLNFVVIFILLWRLWVNNSKKTKINEPIIIHEEMRDKFKFYYIKNQLDVQKNEWKLTVPTNAYPWIYSEVMKAYDKKLLAVFISTSNDNNIYDLGEIKINKAVVIPYLYMEAQSEDRIIDVLENFNKDIEQGEYYKGGKV